MKLKGRAQHTTTCLLIVLAGIPTTWLTCAAVQREGDHHSDTSLMEAAEQGKTETVQRLLKHGADINDRLEPAASHADSSRDKAGLRLSLGLRLSPDRRELRLQLDARTWYTLCMNVITVKYRLFPTRSQQTALEEALEVCRGVYNSFLHWRTFAYETQGQSVGRFEQEKALCGWKKLHPELKTVHAHLLQNVAVRVDLAFSAFYRRAASGEKPGYPRRKGQGGYDSLTWKEYGNGNRLNDHSVSLSKMGDIQAIVHRPLPGVAKNCTVRRHAGKWFACFCCEVEACFLPVSDEKIGIDVGLEKFVALSDGAFIANPRFFRQDEKAVKKAQRKLDTFKQARTHAQKAQRRQARKVVARIHERIRNRRHDFVHQAARRIVNRYGLIALEKLSVKKMSTRPDPKQDEQTGAYLPNGHAAKAGLNKSIGDAAWSMFRHVLTQKAESAGRLVVNINPAYTSQDCSGCGYRPEKDHRKKRSDRWHFCPNCGLSLDRDTNAALNILQNAVGLHSVVGISA